MQPVPTAALLSHFAVNNQIIILESLYYDNDTKTIASSNLRPYRLFL